MLSTLQRTQLISVAHIVSNSHLMVTKEWPFIRYLLLKYNVVLLAFINIVRLCFDFKMVYTETTDKMKLNDDKFKYLLVFFLFSFHFVVLLWSFFFLGFGSCIFMYALRYAALVIATKHGFW